MNPRAQVVDMETLRRLPSVAAELAQIDAADAAKRRAVFDERKHMDAEHDRRMKVLAAEEKKATDAATVALAEYRERAAVLNRAYLARAQEEFVIAHRRNLNEAALDALGNDEVKALQRSLTFELRQCQNWRKWTDKGESSPRALLDRIAMLEQVAIEAAALLSVDLVPRQVRAACDALRTRARLDEKLSWG